MNLDLLQPDAHLTLTFRDKQGERVVPVRVTWTDAREGGTYFGYVPDVADTWRHCAWGNAMARLVPAPYGLQSLAPTPANTTPGTRVPAHTH